jgi:hypothetical protein
MAQYVYVTATGALYSWTPNDTDPVADSETLAANGLAVVSGLAALDSSHAWSASGKTVVSVTPPTPALNITSWQFVMLFTPAEHAAIAASTDAKVQQFLMALQVALMINLNDPIVQGGVNYLVSISLLTQANATLILSGQASE